MSNEYQCVICKQWLSASEVYEYRGEYSCSDHFEQMTEYRDFKRQEIIEEVNSKTSAYAGLDLNPDNPIGRANREIFKRKLEIAGKESLREKEYANGGSTRPVDKGVK